METINVGSGGIKHSIIKETNSELWWKKVKYYNEHLSYISDTIKMAAKAEKIPSLQTLVEKAKVLFKETFGHEATAGGAAPGR